MKERSALDDAVQGAGCRALLDALLEPVRRAARYSGYAVTVHGSPCRDVDLVAVPWVESAKSPEELLEALRGAITSVVGNCIPRDWSSKPHGRRAVILLVFCGQNHYVIDLSVTPRVPQEKKKETVDA